MESEGFNNGTAILKNSIAYSKAGVFELDSLIIQQDPRTVSIMLFEVNRLNENGIPK